jgi:predicted methyltransferase
MERILEKIDEGEKVPYQVSNILFKHGLVKFNGGNVSLTRKGKIMLIDALAKKKIELELRELRPTGCLNEIKRLVRKLKN